MFHELIGDTPQVYKGRSPKLADWKSVEYCLNFPVHYTTEVIIPNTGEKVCHGIDKKRTIDMVKGATFIVSGYGFHGKLQNDICHVIEKTNDVTCDMHLYGGLKKNTYNSFGMHKDTSANFICQMDGETPWKVYDNNGNILIDTILKPMDVLYIPLGMIHCAEPTGKRLSVSIAMWEKKTIDRNYYEV